MMCKYCDETEGTYYAMNWHYPTKQLIAYVGDDDEPVIDVMIMGGKYLYAASERDNFTYAADAYIEIDYCPKCGRKLGGLNEETNS